LGVGRATGAFSVRQDAAPDALSIRLAMDDDARYQAPPDDAQAERVVSEISTRNGAPSMADEKRAKELLKKVADCIQTLREGELKTKMSNRLREVMQVLQAGRMRSKTQLDELASFLPVAELLKTADGSGTSPVVQEAPPMYMAH
jgi:hypothetical protein